MQRIERYRQTPKVFKDLNNSMKMLEVIKKDKNNDYYPESTQALLRNQQKKINSQTVDATSSTHLSKVTGAGYLSNMMNPKNVLSMQTIDINH